MRMSCDACHGLVNELWQFRITFYREQFLLIHFVRDFFKTLFAKNVKFQKVDPDFSLMFSSLSEQN